MPSKIGFASGAARKSAPRNCASASARKKRSKTSGWTSTLAWQSPGSPSPPRFGLGNRSGRAPSWRGDLQPLIPSRLLPLQHISSKMARVGCSARRPGEERRHRPCRMPASPCSACFIRSRSGIYHSLIENPQLVHSHRRPGQYNETVAIAGLLHRMLGLPEAFGLADAPSSMGQRSDTIARARV